MKDTVFYKQAELVLRILPFLKQENVFALKGGIAINFFYRNLPRLSVDIDLTYLAITNREIALADISQRLENLSERIVKQFPTMEIVKRKLSDTDQTIALVIKHRNISVKIEPNLVVRGSVYPPGNRKLCTSAEKNFELSINMQTLSFADLFGSKICAALDRQHPRDLFDVHFLLKNEDITEKIRKAFIVYLISHPRPIVELLNPNVQNINHVYEQEFKGMVFESISLNDLTQTQNYLIQNIKNFLTADERQFLMSFKAMEPQWDLLGLKGIEKLPAVKWKLLNLKKMSKTKHQQALEKLRIYLNE